MQKLVGEGGWGFWKKKKVGQCGGNKKIMQEHGVHVGYKVKEGSDHVVRVLRIQTIRGQ